MIFSIINCIILYDTILCDIILYHVMLYYIILYYIITFVKGKHLSNTTCLTHVFFESGETCYRFRWSLARRINEYDK